jgi:hypothetical protein
MSHSLESQHLVEVDKLLKLSMSGSWFFKNQMQDYADESEIAEIAKRLDTLYDQGVKHNAGRSFNPKYQFHRVADMDTQTPKVYLQLLLPGNHFNAAKLVGEICLHLSLEDHGCIRLSLPLETAAQKLAREHHWKVSEAELEALTTLIEAAKALQDLGSKNLPVTLDVGRDGVKISTGYYNPVDQVRAALAR